jgi:hypothetical protein
MTDEEFIRYCEDHVETPRAGFIPEQLVRLCLLAGRDAAAHAWEGIENRVVDCTSVNSRNTMRRLIGEAKIRSGL